MSIHDSHGFQTGDNNVQINYFGAGGVVLRPEALLEHVRELAPATLEDRDAELAELRAFCFGAEPYVWWQGEPWSGKTALLATFVLKPPAGVDMLHFFIRAGQSYWNDSTAFELTLHSQLTTYLETTASGVRDPSLLHLERAELLRRALDQAQANGRRMVLVVDGIDEDQSRNRASLLPSILTLLPAEPHPALRVVLAGRHQLDLPVDVIDHPALTCRVRRLSGSARAARLYREARLELDTLLRSDSLAQDVLGFAVASEGGISIDEVAELTGNPAHIVRESVVNVGGRTLVVTPYPDGGAGFVFSHESLREQAREALGAAMIGRYRAGIDRWSADYGARRWPADTPFFLLARYGKLLADNGETAPLTALALDSDRHARMRRRLGGDGPALAEIIAAQVCWTREREPDLAAAARLAKLRWELTAPNLHMPPSLPAVWTLLGSPERAFALVGAFEPSPQRTDLQQSIVSALLLVHRFDVASFMAVQIEGPERGAALLAVALDALGQGHPEEADEVIGFALDECEDGIDVLLGYVRARGLTFARSIRDPALRDAALFEVVGALAQDGRTAEAEEAITAIADEGSRAFGRMAVADAGGRPLTLPDERLLLALADDEPQVNENVSATLARCCARAGRYDEAESMLLRMNDPAAGARPLLEIYVGNRAYDRAIELGTRLDLLVTVCDLLAAAGETTTAINIAIDLPPVAAARTLAMIGANKVAEGDHGGRDLIELADNLAAEAGREAAASIAIAVARTGDRTIIERRLRRVPKDRLIAVVHAIARGGWEDATMYAIGLLDDPVEQAEAALTLGETVVGQDRPQAARRAARFAATRRLTGTEFDVDEPDFDPGEADPFDLQQAGEILARAARILVVAGDLDEAARVAAMAEISSRATIDSDSDDADLALVAVARAELGEFAEAEKPARRISDDKTRGEVLGDIALVAARKGDELAARLAEELQGDALQQVIRIFAGDPGTLPLATRMAGRAKDPDERAAALASVAEGYRKAGDEGFANELIDAALAILPPAEHVQLAETAAELAAVAVAMLRLPKVPQLEQRLPLPWQRAVFHAELAARAIDNDAFAPVTSAGHARTAGDIGASLTHPWEACMVYSRLITAWAAIGDPTMVARMVEAALRAARSEGDESAFMLAEPIVLGIDAYLRLGLPDRADRLVDEDPEPAPGIHAYLAERLAESGHRDAALRVAGAIALDDPSRVRWNVLTRGASDDRDDALARVVAVMAKDGGRPENALAVVDRMTSPLSKAQALSDLAVGLAHGNRPIRARQILAAAFALGEWAIPLHGLIEVAPDIARAVISEPES
ncbi:hypothetical protein ACQP2F_28525 [Actinoplanes sp. CA-030573]|uniref:hypothetical protein n=1 Tax=Actinoplanes sp. CA-030573 TaxID=3239898 RepID=UPI003D8FD700